MMKIDSNLFESIPEIEFCPMCGAIRGDFWQTRPMRPVLLCSRPRYGDIKNCWIICDECAEGLQNTALPKSDQIHLLAQIRRATINDQQVVLNWLLQKFGLEANKKS
jgi:hypothetical protein